MDTAVTAACITAAVSLTVGILGVTGPRFRKQDRRLAIVDLATKRITFWEQYLKVELGACEGDTSKKKAKADALSSIARIRKDASGELARLSRQDALQQRVLEPDSSFKGGKKVSWVVLMTLTWVLVSGVPASVFLYLWSFLHYNLTTRALAAESVLLIVYSFLFTALSIWTRSIADASKFPVLKPPVITEI